MFASGNSFNKVIRLCIDVLNVVLGIAVVVMAILTFINTRNNMWMFPFIFLMGGAMNCLTGVKFLLNDRKIGGIVMEIVALVLFVICYASYIAIGGR